MFFHFPAAGRAALLTIPKEGIRNAGVNSWMEYLQAPGFPPPLPKRRWDWSCNGKEEDYLRLPFFKCHGHVSECPHCQVEGGVGMALPRSLPTARRRQAQKMVRDVQKKKSRVWMFSSKVRVGFGCKSLLFQAAGTVLCLGFRMRIMLVLWLLLSRAYPKSRTFQFPTLW